MSSIITEGNLVADPHLRLTANGTPVASATLAVTDRVKDPDDAWTDGPTAYYELTVWGAPADNFAETAVKGSRIVVAGELTVEEYTDRTGQTRTTTRITASHLGLSTRFAPRPAAQPSRDVITAAKERIPSAGRPAPPSRHDRDRRKPRWGPPYRHAVIYPTLPMSAAVVCIELRLYAYSCHALEARTKRLPADGSPNLDRDLGCRRRWLCAVPPHARASGPAPETYDQVARASPTVGAFLARVVRQSRRRKC